ncbi:MAG: NAD(P)/FAD-dependent oxidoreductase [Myxococcota bacterium]
MSETERFDAVAIGAGFCGLAAGAALRANGVQSFAILEQGQGVGYFWSKTYDRIHLHSPWHGLPNDRGRVASYPMFKSRDELISYFGAYADLHGLAPHFRFGERVLRVRRQEPGAHDGFEWRLETESRVFEARFLIVATALNRVPTLPAIPGREAYGGRVLHSSEYRAPAPFAGQAVLVVGSGNSAAEIALDLSEHGARSVSMWVRGPRHFVPRSRMAWLFKFFRAIGMFSDERMMAAHRMRYGTPEFEKTVRMRDSLPSRFSVDLSRFGIRKPAVGPNTETFLNGRIPVFDIGAIGAIRRGAIRIIDGNERPIESFTEKGVCFRGGEEAFDAVILATGFEPRLDEFIAARELLGTGRWGRLMPVTDGRSRSTVHPSVWFPGFDITPNGGWSLGPWGWEAGEAIAEQLGRRA